MKSTLLFLGLVLASGVGAESESKSKVAQYKDDEGIYHLSFDEADDILEQRKVVFVMFHAPWIEKSNQILLEFRLAHEKLKDSKSEITFALVDVSLERDLGYRFGVTDYPSLKVFRDGKPYEFRANRTRFGMLDGLTKYLDPEWSEAEVTHTVELTDKTFDSFVKNQMLTMVKFFVPWCNHCKQLAFPYEEAAKQLKELDPPVQIAKINCDDHASVCNKFTMKGYPHLIYFRKGKEEDYKGVRSTEGIFHFLKARNEQPSKEIEPSLSAVNILTEEIDDDVIIGFFNEYNSYEYQVFDRVADDLHTSLKFRHMFKGIEVAQKHFGVKSDDYAVIIFRNKQFLSKYDERFVVYEDDGIMEEDIAKWIVKNINPLVGQISEETTRTRYSSRPMVTVLYDIDWEGDLQQVTRYTWNRIVNVAKDFTGKNLTFAVGDQESLVGLDEYLGLGDMNEDVLVSIWERNSTRYPLLEEFSEESLREHVQNYLDGKAEPYMRSLQPPKKNDGPVKVIVGKTFQKLVVNDRSKDILLYFFAPWHATCKKFDSVYRKVGKKYQGNENIMIARYDASNNDVPSGFTINEYPTIYLLKQGDERDEGPLTFTGKLNSKEVMEFLEENAASFVNEGDVEEGAKDEL